MSKYVIQLRDTDGNVVDGWVGNSAMETEVTLRKVGSTLIAYDDARFDGNNDFCSGSLVWWEIPD